MLSRIDGSALPQAIVEGCAMYICGDHDAGAPSNDRITHGAADAIYEAFFCVEELHIVS